MIGNVHEFGQIDVDTWIDQYNNQVARNIMAMHNPSNSFWAAFWITFYYNLGWFITDQNDPRVPPEVRNPPGNPEPPDPIDEGPNDAHLDVNGNGMVDMIDFAAIVSALGSSLPGADLTADGTVTVEDAIEWATKYLRR